MVKLFQWGRREPAPADPRVAAILAHGQVVGETLAAVLAQNVKCAPCQQKEVDTFVIAASIYAYRRYAGGAGDVAFVSAVAQAIGSTVFTIRCAEYAALIDALLEKPRDEDYQRRWLTTILMHVVEHASGRHAEGHMLAITFNAPVVAAVLDDGVKFAREKLARKRRP